MVTMKGKKRTNQQRPRGICGSFKALFQSILIQAGCLSPSEQDDAPVQPRERRWSHSGRLQGNHSFAPGSYNNNSNSNNNDNHTKGHNRRNQQCPKDAFRDAFRDGIEDRTGANVKTSGAMFSLQNCTLHCDECRNGETYWASFTERSFHRGHRFKLYRGIINGQGPQSGEKCVVKVFLRRPGTEDLCRIEARKSERLRQLLRDFNQRTKRLQDKIRCPQTYWAPVDEVSKLKQLFFTGQRKLLIGESVLFEPDIRFSDDRPREPRKVTRFMDSKGKQPGHRVTPHPVLDAFAHFTYHKTGGQLVACGFEGVEDDEEGFTLITPVIHSREKSYGEGDLGDAGIMAVFNNHVCNELCQGLTIPCVLKPDVARRPVKVTFTLAEQDEEGETTTTKGRVEVEDVGEEEDVGESTSMWSGPGCRRRDSLDGCSSLPFKTSLGTSTSKASECSIESMTAYLEPSAPDLEDDVPANEHMPPPPPAYTRERAEHVIHWIQEEYSNSFLHMCLPQPTGSASTNPSSAHPSSSLPPSSSSRSLTVTGQTMMTSMGGDANAIRRSSDANANLLANQLAYARNPDLFAHYRQDTTSVPGTTTRSDDVIDTVSMNSAASTRSFSVPSTRGGASSSSEAATSTRTRSDVAMTENSGSTAGSYNSHSQPGRGRQGSVGSVDNAFFGDHLRLLSQTSSDENRNNTRSMDFFLDRLPSYEESESMHPNRFASLDSRRLEASRINAANNNNSNNNNNNNNTNMFGFSF